MFAILLWDRGNVRAGGGRYATEEEARRELLRWDRVVGRDNHPVYALCVVPYRPNAKYEVPRRIMVKALEKVFAEQQRERLLALSLLEEVKQRL